MLARDWIAVIALAVMAYGFWCAWAPLGYIVPSVIVLALAIAGKMRAG